MGERSKRERQAELWIATGEIVETPGHAFYDRLNEVLGGAGFDRRVEHLCRRYYRGHRGRPSMAPGVYFRMLLVGYFEGLDSERAIAWRVADSLSLRKFLGYGLDEKTPDHSTLSRTRRLYWLSTHQAVFGWVLNVLAEAGLVRGETIAIDATTLEANAAMRSIVRRDTGEAYEAYVRQLAEAEGLEDPTRAQLARFDRKRRKKGANQEWKSPDDADARITRMKDGRTHLAHKAEHAVDLSTGALVSVTLQPADQGDTTTIFETLDAADVALQEIGRGGVREVVADKGYHSATVLVGLHARTIRSYVCEPDRGPRRWTDKPVEQQKQVYGNRRRLRRRRNQTLQSKRQELAERSFAHMYETGSMRRLYLRGRTNILKRLVLHGAGFNLALYMRSMIGAGTPRQLTSGLIRPLIDLLARLWRPPSIPRTSFPSLLPYLATLRPQLATPLLLSAAA